MKNQKQVNQNGVTFLGLLFIVFLVLKLTKVIDWSWWYVSMPLWIGLAVVALVFIVGTILFGLATIFTIAFKSKK